MKRILSLIFCAAICVLIAACNSKQIDGNGVNSPPATPTAPETATGIPVEPEKTADNLNDMHAAYYTALENLIQNHILPDGTDLGEEGRDMAENKFALYDVDNDGKEELLLMYTNTIVAGQKGYVFAYDGDTKQLHTELCEFPILTFYDNGIIKAGWSHNQGRGGEFWPYDLYQYAPDSDSYAMVGMVDAWDKRTTETGNQKNPFPVDIDKSGTGFVYYIIEDGHVRDYDKDTPVDASVYNEWINGYIGNASEIQIQYRDLTEENISLMEPQKLSVNADVNRDGREEAFYLDKTHMESGDVGVALRVYDGDDHEIWSEYAGLPHVGWNQLFLCELDGKQYLLRYNPGMFQGICTYEYTLFTLENGKERVYRTNKIDFDVNGTARLDAAKMVAFAEEVNALLGKTTLLLSSEGGEFFFGPASADPFFERYSWLDDNPGLYADGDSLETRLNKYSEYVFSNRR
jgi:uncharacterized protein YheU (UPF0270 family)